MTWTSRKRTNTVSSHLWDTEVDLESRSGLSIEEGVTLWRYLTFTQIRRVVLTRMALSFSGSSFSCTQGSLQNIASSAAQSAAFFPKPLWKLSWCLRHCPLCCSPLFSLVRVHSQLLFREIFHLACLWTASELYRGCDKGCDFLEMSLSMAPFSWIWKSRHQEG